MLQNKKVMQAEDKEHYLRSICVQVESALAQKISREVYDAVRKITGKQASRVRVVRDKKVMQEIPIHQLVVDTTLSLLRAEVEAAIRRLKTKKEIPGPRQYYSLEDSSYR